LRAALVGPDPTQLAGKNQAAMNAFMGLVLYVDRLAPDKITARSLKLIGSTRAGDYPAAAVAAVEEAEPFTVKLPPGSSGKPIWLPLGRSWITGAKLLRRRAGWVLVRPTGGAIVVTPPPRR
jgi:hypothetical protein